MQMEEWLRQDWELLLISSWPCQPLRVYLHLFFLRFRDCIGLHIFFFSLVCLSCFWGFNHTFLLKFSLNSALSKGKSLLISTKTHTLWFQIQALYLFEDPKPFLCVKFSFFVWCLLWISLPLYFLDKWIDYDHDTNESLHKRTYIANMENGNTCCLMSKYIISLAH